MKLVGAESFKRISRELDWEVCTWLTRKQKKKLGILNLEMGLSDIGWSYICLCIEWVAIKGEWKQSFSCWLVINII